MKIFFSLFLIFLTGCTTTTETSQPLTITETIPVVESFTSPTSFQETNSIETFQETIPIETEPQKIEKFTEVPLFFQTDYPYNKYGNFGTISDHGCGIVSLSMVASYLNDKLILPDELAAKYGKYNTKIGSDWTLFSETCEELNIRLEDRTWDINLVVDALKEGKVVIANAHKESPFTNGGHYIVLKGITDDGKILVNDPYKGNYGQWNGPILSDGFKNGFDVKYFYDCFPMWIYEKKNNEVITNTQKLNPQEYERIEDNLTYYFYPGESNKLIVWLHDVKDRGINELAFTNTGLSGVLNSWELNDVKPYILCPQLFGTQNRWDEKNVSEILFNLIDIICEDYGIEEIILMGQGEGARAAINLSQEKSIFSKLILFSTYSTKIEIINDIPVTFYVGKKELGEDIQSIKASNDMMKKFSNTMLMEINAARPNLMRAVMNIDENEDGYSDFFENI